MRTAAALVAATLLSTLVLAAVPLASSLPTPGLFCEESRATTGRLFPEAEQTNDYVSYREAVCGLEILAAEHPDLITIHRPAKSVGWDNLAGGHDQFDVLVVEMTDRTSPIPLDARINVLFQLSIHGNEKGGREGGLRVIEDLATGMGVAEEKPELVSYLGFMRVLFVFPNPDGWIHEEAQYRHNCPDYVAVGTSEEQCVETQSFVRVNGNGFDLNRNSPTVGWAHEPYQVLSQPEVIGLVNFLKTNFTKIHYASDIHGMLQPADCRFPLACETTSPFPQPGAPTGVPPRVNADTRGHFVLTMLPAGRQDQEEMVKTTSLAELIKERLNENPKFAEWQALPESLGVWGGEFNDWGTVWDTIGYTDSGFTSDFYAQDIGLNAPGVDFELAYNHITFDNYYPAVAQRINGYHVESVRVIVGAFMDQAARDIEMSVDVKGLKTAYVVNPKVITNADDEPGALTGWALENPNDDAFDIAHKTFEASPNDYFVDLAAVAKDGEAPAVVDPLTAAEINPGRLSGYDNLVVAGSAYDQLAGNANAVAAIRSFVEAGGNLFVSDSALQLLEDLGAVDDGSVDHFPGYAGATNFVDPGHELAANVRGLARQTYEPVPLGFGVRGDSSPIWYVKGSAFSGEVVGVAGEGSAARPDAEKVNLGRVALGEGRISFLGALLPDPSEEQYHPYGLDSYATTYTGNQILRNALGFDVVFASTPVVAEDLGDRSDLAGNAGDGETQGDGGAAVPGVGALALLAGIGVAVAVGARRR